MRCRLLAGVLLMLPSWAFAEFPSITFPPGVTVLTQPITINTGMTVRGAGMGATYLELQGEFCAFLVDTPHAVTFQDFSIVAQSPQISGCGIRLAGSQPHTDARLASFTPMNLASRIQNVGFYDLAIGVWSYRAAEWVLRDCKIQNATYAGVLVENPAAPDAGDSTIDGCTILNKRDIPSVGILQTSGGGLRITNNKINGPMHIGVQLQVAAGTSQLLISGNSIENQRFAAIYIGTNTAAPFMVVTIQNNAVSPAAWAGPQQWYGILLVAPNVQRIHITGNVIGAYWSLATPTVGIAALAGEDIWIDGNTFAHLSIGIVNPVGGDVGHNSFYRMGVPLQ